MDQAAVFSLSIINKVKQQQPDWSGKEVVTYMLSVEGSASLWPPDPELEPDAVEYYSGPRPPSPLKVAIGQDRTHPFAEQFLVLEGGDDKRISAKAYRNKTDKQPYFTWQW